MRAFLAAIVVMAAITVGADFALRHVGFSAAETASGEAVRLGD